MNNIFALVTVAVVASPVWKPVTVQTMFEPETVQYSSKAGAVGPKHQKQKALPDGCNQRKGQELSVSFSCLEFSRSDVH